MKNKFYFKSFYLSLKSSIFIILFFITVNQIYLINSINLINPFDNFSKFNQSSDTYQIDHQNDHQNYQNQLTKRINRPTDQLIANLHIYNGQNLNRILDKKSSDLNIDRKENKLIQRFKQDHLNSKRLNNRKYEKLNYRRREDHIEDDENRDKYEEDELNNEKSNGNYNLKVNKDEESTVNELNNESNNDENNNNNETNSDTNQDEENKNERSPDYNDDEYKNNKQKFENEQPRSNKDDYDSKENENNVPTDDDTKYEIKEEIEEEKTKDDDDDLKDDEKFKDDLKDDEKFKNEFIKQDNNKKNDNKYQIHTRKPAFENNSGIRYPLVTKYSRQFTPKPRFNSFDKTIKLKDNLVDNRLSNSFYNKVKDSSKEDKSGDNSNEINYSAYDLNRINLNQDNNANNKFEKHEELLIELLKKRFLNNQKRLLELKKEEKRKQFLNEIDESFTIRKLNKEAHKYAEIERKLNRLINLIQNQQKQKELNSRFINYPTTRDLFNNNNLLDSNSLFDYQNLDQRKYRTIKKTKFRPLNSNAYIYSPQNKFYPPTKIFNPINQLPNNQFNWLNEYSINKNNYQLSNPLNYHPNYSIKRYPIFKKIKSTDTTQRTTKTNQFNEKLSNLAFNLFGPKQTNSNLFQTILHPTLDSNFRKLSAQSPIKYQYHLLQNLQPSIPLRLFTNDRSLTRTSNNKVTRLPQLGGIMLRGSGYSNH